MTQQPHPGAAILAQHAARAALLLPLVLLGCSAIVLPREDAPAAGPDPAYYAKIVTQLQSSFKDIGSYDSFEISEFRWVHSVDGWSWLSCVRFQDHGRRHTYALFIRGDEITKSRFAVKTDDCEAQNYSPFTQLPNAAGAADGSGLEPLY